MNNQTTKWQAANYGTGKRMWFVCKPATRQYLEGKNGRLIWFASSAAAKARAEALNAAEGWPTAIVEEAASDRP